MVVSTQKVLVTGGSGFIDTRAVVQLLNSGFHASTIDNFDNSAMEAVDRVRELVGSNISQNLEFTRGDLKNKDDLKKLFAESKFDVVVHFAGLKAVGESVVNPRCYFDNNLAGTVNLYEVMAKHNCKKMVFSSSATVYGQPEKISCMEDFKLQAMNPYGRTSTEFAVHRSRQGDGHGIHVFSGEEAAGGGDRKTAGSGDVTSSPGVSSSC